MNIQYIQSQIDTYWTTNVKNYYSISLTTLYKTFPPKGKIGSRKQAKPKIPDDWLTPMERRDLYYKATGLEMTNREDNLRQNQERKVKAREFVEEYRKSDVIAPKYEWPFAEFFNRF